ncbi:MAG: S41 family peptidase [Phycisphaerales bacterium]|nr:S41 family peptidase [Phycisphaerales bacterium]
MIVLSILCMTAGVEGFYRQPAIHDDTVVFVAEGDLWRVPVDGGTAHRLTAHEGLEQHPVISPDGSTVAFLGQYEGPTEVYTMPISGGVPRRHTWGSEPRHIAGFSADGTSVLISTTRFNDLPKLQMAAVDLDSGNTQVLPLDPASDGVFADDGTLYFTRHPYQGSATKRYVGGTARKLWAFGAGADEATPLMPDSDMEAWAPMLVDGRLWYVTDGGAVRNLWSMRTDGSDARQETLFGDYGVQDPCAHGDSVVFQQGADLHVHDADLDRTRKIPVTLASDLDRLTERWVTDPYAWVTAVQPSPDGKHVLATARGELFLLPVAPNGTQRRQRVDANSAVRYRDGRFLPDGSILALSDATGELNHVRFDRDALDTPIDVTTDSQVHRMGTAVSPDGKTIAWHDKHFEIWVHDVESGESKTIAAAPHGQVGALVFSPCSTRLAWSHPVRPGADVIHVHDLDTGDTTPVTSDRVASTSPTFSVDGTWLFFVSERHFRNATRSPWGNHAPDPQLENKRVICMASLTDERRSPFKMDDEVDMAAAAAKAEADEASSEEAQAAEAGTEDDSAAEAASDDATEDTESSDDQARPEWNLADVPVRTMQLDVPASDYSRVVCGNEHLFVVDDGKLKAVALKPSHELKLSTVADNVRQFDLTADRSHMLVGRGNQVAVVKTRGSSFDMDDHDADTAGWRFAFDPREEYAQMFREAWRLHRDYFYDPGMHGLDWGRVLAKYAPLVERITDRRDLSDVLAQMMGELSVLHTYVGGGDLSDVETSVAVGTLGAHLEPVDEGLRIAWIPRTDPDFPVERSPLDRPDVDVIEGDVITHVNATPVQTHADLGRALRGEVGRPVRLTLAPRAGEEDARNVMSRVVSTRAERELQYDAWEHDRRTRVDEASDKAIGYVHVRAMGGSNYAQDFARNFFPVYDRQGIIIDMRHNRGGNIDSWLLTKLMKQPWMYWQGHAGEPTWNMQYAPRGHMVVLCDEGTASDGEAFCDGFRRLGLGEAIGTRTWGGEVWLSHSNRLVDRGIASAAEYGVYGPEGEWLIEGRGFEPDHVVDNLPHETFNGRDRQLEAAIAHLQTLIAEDPRDVPPPPPGPDHAPEDLRPSP